MATLESLVQASSTDTLIKSLSFIIPNAASYVLARHPSTFYPLGGNQYTATGVRTIRIVVNDATQFLDPSTMRLQVTVNNLKADKILKFGLPPQAMFARARLLVAGTLIEDIPYLNRLTALNYYTDNSERTVQDEIESEWQDGIPAARARVVSMPLNFFGLLQSDKMIFLRYAPLTIELDLVQEWTDCLCEDAGGTLIAPADMGANISITDVQLKCDTCVVSQSIMSQYVEHLVGQQSLPIAFSSFAISYHTVPTGQPNFDLQTTRALSKLRSVFVVFNTADDGTVNATKGGRFASPLQGAASNANAQPSWQLQIGARVWPTQPVRSSAETWSQLRQALDMSRFGLLNITKEQWRGVAGAEKFHGSRWIIGIDVERAGNASSAANFTGLSTRSGEPVMIQVRGWPAAPAATHAHIFLFHDAICNVEQSGVTLLD